ncbi:uncharacterized protein BT62DRAFT_1002159 [Guyanagaster necrorhizus]|uniref:Uncharacterized protein n=1 Tax=Guyanagaster necrorhizus TaxID=856835 RepID=A0A9P7VZY0_9AGAR|nr:uncharacterized protein BT62DRAFT_1002159 [Guyanagaster necrorhizus MCA 3950]KAG7449845.1 hypothetical protein BT62DRAFT_1002159 [Guyanagaster necrorhizus MCA 3950]
MTLDQAQLEGSVSALTALTAFRERLGASRILTESPAAWKQEGRHRDTFKKSHHRAAAKKFFHPAMLDNVVFSFFLKLKDTLRQALGRRSAVPYFCEPKMQSEIEELEARDKRC